MVYEARSRRLVSAWKERGRRDLASALADIVVGAIPRPAVEALTFVPGDRERGRERGHVPAQRLADELGARWSIPVQPLLARTGMSRRQAGLPRAERRANVRGAFAASSRAPPSVAIIDDVYTTGATVSACASVLRRAGACRVEVVCLARAVR